jgi:hypothetical protein
MKHQRRPFLYSIKIQKRNMKHLKITTLLAALLCLSASLQAQCNGLKSTINENFNAVANGQRPACWTGFYTHVTSVTANYCQAGEYRIQRINQGAAIPEHFMVVLPMCTMKGPLSFDLRKYPNSGYLALEVGSLSNPSDPMTFTVQQVINYNSSTPLRHTVDFTNYAGTNKYIALRAYLLPGQGFGFDNLTWSGPLPIITPAMSPKGM